MRRLVILILIVLFPIPANAMLYPRMGAKPDLNDFGTRDLICWYPMLAGDGVHVANLPSSAGPALPTAVAYTDTSGIVFDAERGWVFAADGTDDGINTQWYGGNSIEVGHGMENGGAIFLRDYTVSCWIRPFDGRPLESNDAYWGAVNSLSTHSATMAVLNSGQIQFVIAMGTGLAYAKTNAAVFVNNLNPWTHVVCTVNYGIRAAGAMQIYVNGEKQVLAVVGSGDTSVLPDPWVYGSNIKIWLMRWQRAIDYPVWGRCDDFRFYKRHLSDWEIKKIYRDSYQIHPVRSDPVYLWRATAKNNSVLNDWVSIAENTVEETGEIDASNFNGLAISLSIAVVDIQSQTHDGTGIVAQVSSSDSGDENWTDLVKFYMPVIQEKYTAVNPEIFDNNEAPGQTVLEIGNTTGFYDDDGTRWIAARDVGTIADSEMLYLESHVAGTSVTVVDGLTNAKDNVNDYLTDICETRTIYIPSVYKRVRFILDQTYDVDADGPAVMMRTRYSDQQEVISGQIIRLVH